ncbi:toll/interleukin-1 receptor domain-containing protein [Methylomagnum sp.]
MVQLISFDDIERFNKQVNEQELLARASRSQYGKTVFLSHSSKDKAYLPGIISILENHGASVYVDLKDERLPKNVSVETAQILREAVNSCRKFILFVTANSKDSKWIPWELGLGDGAKSLRNIALIPAAQHTWDSSWAEQEYLGLYDRIVWGNFDNQKPEWLVYNHHNNTAIRLSEWLSR